jgi:hypothetical protein
MIEQAKEADGIRLQPGAMSIVDLGQEKSLNVD